MSNHALPQAVVGNSSVDAPRLGGVGPAAPCDPRDTPCPIGSEFPRGGGLSAPDGEANSTANERRGEPLGPWVEAPRPGLSGPIAEVIGTPARLWPWRELFGAWVRRSLSARFRGTRLGPLWPVIQPLFLFGVYGWLFTRLFAPELRGGSAELAIGPWIFFGAVVWTGLSEGVLRSTTSLAEQPDLVRRGAFPPELLPLAAVAVAAIEGGIGLLVYVLGAALTPWASWPEPEGLLLLATLAASSCLVSGLALGCAALQPRWTDLRPLLGVLLTAGLFASPIFWVPDPEIMPGLAPWRDVLAWSPLVAFVESWRHAFVGSMPEGATLLPSAKALGLLSIYGTLALLAGATVFRMRARRVVDEV